jgi:hypothetical protein
MALSRVGDEGVAGVLVMAGVAPHPEGLKHPAGDRCHVVDRSVKRGLIGVRRCVKAADLADELERGLVQLRVSWCVIGVAQAFDVAAHGSSSVGNGRA